MKTSIAVFWPVVLIAGAVLVMCGCGSGGGGGGKKSDGPQAHAGWSKPGGLQANISPNGTAAMSPDAAMNAKGDALIVWWQSDGSHSQIFKSERRNGKWTHPLGLADNISPDGTFAFDPHVAMSSNGDAVVVWYQSDGMRNQIFKSECRGGAWTHPSSLTDNISPDGEHAYDPRVAMDANGDAILVWTQSDGNDRQIFKSECRGGTWTHPAGLADNISPDGTNADDPAVAMGADGSAIIAWAQSNFVQPQIFKSEYRGGVWQHPGSLADKINPGATETRWPQVAIGGKGSALIVWEQDDGADHQIFKSEYRGGAWLHPSDLKDNISPDNRFACAPQVAMDAKDSAVVAWWQETDLGEQIFKSELRKGVWTHPANLADNIDPDGGCGTEPEVAMNSKGDTIIVWCGYDGTDSQVFKSEFRKGAWRHPSDLDDHVSLDGAGLDWMMHQAAISDGGGAVIVWVQSDGTNPQVFMSERK